MTQNRCPLFPAQSENIQHALNIPYSSLYLTQKTGKNTVKNLLQCYAHITAAHFQFPSLTREQYFSHDTQNIFTAKKFIVEQNVSFKSTKK